MDSNMYNFNSFNNLAQIEQKLSLCGQKDDFDAGKAEFKTAECYDSNQTKQNLKSRSIKPQNKSKVEVSFEFGILDEHFQAIKKLVKLQLGEFENSIQTSQEGEQITFVTKDPLENTQELNKLIISNSIIRMQKKNQLIVDLQRQPNLTKFIVFLSLTFCEELSSNLIALSCEVWENYVSLLDGKQILITSEFMEKLQQEMTSDPSEDFQVISDNLKALQKDEQLVKEFLNQFIETIYLVIEEFFDNPYADNGLNPFKRERPEPEFDFSNQSDFQDSWQFTFKKVEKMRKI